jgi:hypothetical protein
MKPKSYAWLGGSIGGWVFFVILSLGFCWDILITGGLTSFTELMGAYCADGASFCLRMAFFLPFRPFTFILVSAFSDQPIGLGIVATFALSFALYVLIGAGLGFLYGKIKNKNKNTKV